MNTTGRHIKSPFYDLGDVIDCDECGHDVFSAHDLGGCGLEGCPCEIRWTRDEKRAFAKREGVTFR
jgi:hypothetical protein